MDRRGRKSTLVGGRANEKTCQTRPRAQATRIDGILASREAVAWITNFEVEKDDMIPTHAVLKVNLQGGAAAEERTFAKKAPSLKKAYERKLEKLTKDLDDKGIREASKREKENLKQHIRKEIAGVKTKLEVLAQAKDTDSYWRAWSKAVERGWLRYSNEDEVYNPKYV